MSPSNANSDDDPAGRVGDDRRPTSAGPNSSERSDEGLAVDSSDAASGKPTSYREPARSRGADPRSERSTLVNGLVGALVTILLFSVVPFAPLFGGLVSGYLEGRDVAAGVLAGLVAGVLAAIVTVFAAITFGTFMLGFAAMGAGPAFFGGLVILLFFVGALYTVGFALVGGALGAYLNREFGDDIGRI